MKNTKRFILGVISSLFLAVGLARAADTLDPIANSFPETETSINGTAPDTSELCVMDVEE